MSLTLLSESSELLPKRLVHLCRDDRGKKSAHSYTLHMNESFLDISVSPQVSFFFFFLAADETSIASHRRSISRALELSRVPTSFCKLIRKKRVGELCLEGLVKDPLCDSSTYFQRPASAPAPLSSPSSVLIRLSNVINFRNRT